MQTVSISAGDAADILPQLRALNIISIVSVHGKSIDAVYMVGAHSPGSVFCVMASNIDLDTVFVAEELLDTCYNSLQRGHDDTSILLSNFRSIRLLQKPDMVCDNTNTFAVQCWRVAK